METPRNTLVDRVEELDKRGGRPLVWGNPLLTVTPRSLAIRDLAVRVVALEDALRDLALQVEQLSTDANRDSCMG